MSLPAFRYHPDPPATGSVIRSDARCVCCGDARGDVYAGPVYAVDEYEQCICPWCIADELNAHGPQASASIRASTGLDEGADWARFFAALDKDGSPTAYVFRCIHCGELGGYQDCD
ncbi:CbrC family protein [Burkholderia pyrrocinia]|uniref:CbrC family protein n=1 Tax=Burkholderia pyrrocinia TaxID=60550 RepID=UPI002AB0690C|nr:CbrC family protein [Burkholderia pyrrocinia]